MNIPSNLVSITDISPNIKVDVIYATADNFIGEVLYQKPLCLFRREVAQKLHEIQQELEVEGLGLLIWDGYRPPKVQSIMREKFPLDGYVAIVSNHSRGIAVDLTICQKDGTPLDMPTEFDCLTKLANHDNCDCSEIQDNNRKKLKIIMTKHGFKPLGTEWWHYDYAPMLDEPVIDFDF